MATCSVAFSDDFQSYTYVTDPAFTSNYFAYDFGTGTGTSLIETAPFDSLALRASRDSAYLAGGNYYLINSTRISASYPFSYSLTLRNGSGGSGVNAGYNFISMMFFTNATTAGEVTYAHAYRINYDTVNGDIDYRRCPSNIVSVTCGVSLNSTTSNVSDVFGKDTRFTVAMDGDRIMKFFIDGNQMLSYYDSSNLYSNGSLIFGMQTGSGTLLSYFDDLAVANLSSGATLTLVSYPDRIPNNLTYIEMGNNSIANWMALNLPFDIQFSFNTPAGEMNKVTEAICPVRLFGEERRWEGNYLSPQPQVYAKATDANSVGKCVRRVEYSTTYANIYTPAIFGIPFTCYSPQQCLITWSDAKSNVTVFDQPITADWTSSGAWEASYKIYDTNGKMLYRTVDYVCSSPANLTIDVDYIDKNGCTGYSGITSKQYTIDNIGISPCTNDTCDYQANASCWSSCNGSSGRAGTPTVGSGNHTLFCELNPSDGQCVGGGTIFCELYPNDASCKTPAYCVLHPTAQQCHDRGFDLDQLGNLGNALMTPAFIGIIICLTLALIGAIYGGQLIGALGFIGGFFFLTWWGLFPLWVGLGVIMLASFATVYLVRDIFTSG
jgi:hypothetical protein